LRLCLTNDPALGVVRHADAGYETALTVARERGLDLPSLGISDRSPDERHDGDGRAHDPPRGAS
ncbi:MAG: hypothetical protein EA416_16970, partial [Trueperaceae bacterium]